MEHIVLRTGLGGDGALEVHGLADIGIVLLAVIAGGVLFNGLDVGGHFVLLFHHDIGIGGVQRAQRTQRGVHQIVAQIQTGEGHRSGGGRYRTLIGDAVVLGILLGSLGESGSVSAVFPGHIALCVHFHIGALDGVAVDKGVPGGSGLVGIGICGGIVALQIEDLIDGVGLADNGVIDGDAAGFAFREGGGGQGKGHDQGQQYAGKFFHMLHFSFSFLIVSIFLL